MLLIELSMNPLGKNESVAQDVAKILHVIDRSGLDYKLGPMGTCIEGEWDDVMDVVKKCFIELESDCNRITFSIKGDWRIGDIPRMDSKIESIEKNLKRKVNT
jgi:uncharacterized protein (TIGR00106 family)